MADCCRENSRDKLDLLFFGEKDKKMEELYLKTKQENPNPKFKERDPQETERLRKVFGLEEKFKDLVKVSPWEQLRFNGWL